MVGRHFRHWCLFGSRSASSGFRGHGSVSGAYLWHVHGDVRRPGAGRALPPAAEVTLLGRARLAGRGWHIPKNATARAERYATAAPWDWEAEKAHLAQFPPEKMEAICGIPAETLRAVAREFATAKSGMIFWGMGISQHIHGTDNSRCLISLSLMTGHVGRPGGRVATSGDRAEEIVCSKRVGMSAGGQLAVDVFEACQLSVPPRMDIGDQRAARVDVAIQA